MCTNRYTLETHEIPDPNCTIEQIHMLYEQGVRYVDEPLVVQGIVSANDKGGTLFKSFIIEQEGYAVEVLEGIYDSFVRRPYGTAINLSLSGLAMHRNRGILQVGLRTNDDSKWIVDYFGSEIIADRYISISSYQQPLTPHKTTISELDESMCGRLIAIENLSLNIESEEDLPLLFGGYNSFSDSELGEIYTYVSPYAPLAYTPIPTHEISICGILQYSEVMGVDKFVIIPREDVDISSL